MTIKTPGLQEALAVLLQRQRKSGKLVIDYPVSLLQRHFRLGYTATVVLMNELEKRGSVHRVSETAIQLRQDSRRETADSS